VDVGDERDPPLRKPGPNSVTARGATGALAGLKVIDPAPSRTTRAAGHSSTSDSLHRSPPTRADQWWPLLEGSNACFAPVLTLSDRAKHAHRAQRAALVELSGPSPAPVGAVPDGAGDPPRRYPP
jgi:alpha-methylacyl-CoA racemase